MNALHHCSPMQNGVGVAYTDLHEGAGTDSDCLTYKKTTDMATHKNETGTPETSSPPPSRPPVETVPALTLYAPYAQPSPLPGNRPIADNSTEDINDMLGYLD